MDTKINIENGMPIIIRSVIKNLRDPNSNIDKDGAANALEALLSLYEKQVKMLASYRRN